MSISKKEFNFLDLDNFDTIIDVRSPKEFVEDHMIGSINLPVLNNEEREIVGKIYVQESKFQARLIGAKFITKNISNMLNKQLSSKPRNWSPLIYCWRGGKRSYSLAKILYDVGWKPTILEKGYKSYRYKILETLHKKEFNFKTILISGHTGTGKTEILEILKKKNMQILDLELMANHRGSLLGAEKKSQPSQKLFESKIFKQILNFNKNEPIIIEAESNKIGNLTIPPSLWSKMKLSNRIEIKAKKNHRVEYLKERYSDLTNNVDSLIKKLSKFKNIQNNKNINVWIKMAEEKKFNDLALDLIEIHYDPRYQNNLNKNSHLFLKSFSVNPQKKVDMENVSEEISLFIKSIINR